MKKITLLYSAVALLALASCGGGKSDEAAKADSARQADSIAAVQKAAEQAAQAAEQARQDSLRQDSIDKAQAFTNALPDPQIMLKKTGKQRGSYLSSLGFKGSQKTTYDEMMGGEYSSGNYTFSVDGKTCTIKWDEDFNQTTITVTINGDETALNAFYAKSKKVTNSGMESGCNTSKSGNTITIDSFGA